jgi:DNA-directed RNA polymerase subunit RPC12/RpoP
MSMNIGGNGPGGPQKMGINVDLSKIDNTKCIRCNNEIFLMAGKLKMVNPIISPSGKWDMAVNAEWRCSKCGWAFKIEEWQQAETKKLMEDQKGRVQADG